MIARAASLVALLGLVLAPAWAATEPAARLAEQLVAEARQLVEAGDAEAALARLERLRRLAAAPPELRGRGELLRGYLLAERGRRREAAAAFAAAAAVDALPAAEREQARYSAAGLLLVADDPAAALQQLPERDASAREQALRGQILLRLKRPADAVAALRSALSQADQEAAAIPEEWRRLLVNALIGTGQWNAAIAEQGRWLAARPDSGEGWKLLGELYLQADEPAQAAAAWQTAAALGALDGSARLNLVRLYLSLGLPEPGLALLAEQSGDADPERAALRATALELARRPEEAVAAWRRAVALAGRAEHRLALARLLSRLERWPQADAAWRAYVAGVASGLGAEDRVSAAVAAFRSGDTQGAIEWLRPIVEDARHGELARSWLEYLSAAAQPP